VLAIGEAGDVDELIARAERFYRSRDARPLFQVTTASTPRSLVGELEARGYRPAARTLVLDAATDVVADNTMTAPRFARRVDLHPTEGWFDAYWSIERTRGRTPGDDAICRDVLLRPALPTSFVTVVDGQEVIGVGQVVVEHGWAGVQCMATPPAHRRRGAASAVLNALAVQALALWAERMYLAVMADNAGARSLYERAGFRPVHEYCYFTAP
jgi:ribosomal protein S18 acetylase RimI-like enzyme